MFLKIMKNSRRSGMAVPILLITITMISFNVGFGLYIYHEGNKANAVCREVEVVLADPLSTSDKEVIESIFLKFENERNNKETMLEIKFDELSEYGVSLVEPYTNNSDKEMIQKIEELFKGKRYSEVRKPLE